MNASVSREYDFVIQHLSEAYHSKLRGTIVCKSVQPCMDKTFNSYTLWAGILLKSMHMYTAVYKVFQKYTVLIINKFYNFIVDSVKIKVLQIGD